MTEFEVLLVPLSLILGLGVTEILSGLIRALRSRRKRALHWIPLTWALSILCYNILYFNVLYDQYQLGRQWTWALYGSLLSQSILIFLAAGLVFPKGESPSTRGLLADFEEDGKLALVPLGILLATAPLANRYQHDAPWLGLNNVLNVLLTGMIVVMLFGGRRRLRSAISVAFALTTVLGMLFVWSSPGD